MPALTIITAIASRRDRAAEHLVEVGYELDAIRDALQPAIREGILELVAINAITAEKLVRAFQEASSPVVGFHFAGHTTELGLLLSEGTAGGQPLANFLRQQAALTFVFLNGCGSSAHVEKMHAAGVPVVIATSEVIPDQEAMEVARHFYTALGQGKDLATAFDRHTSIRKLEGKTGLEVTRGVALPSAEGYREFPWRMAYAEGQKDKAGWSLGQAARRPLFGLPDIPIKYDLPVQPFHYLERYNRRYARLFFGRAYEIRDLYRKITAPGLPSVLLFYGQSGVGKSSLLEAGVLPRLEATYETAYLRRDAQAGLPRSVLQLLECENRNELRACWKDREQASGKPLLLILDQLEEMYTQPLSSGPHTEIEELLGLLLTVFERVDLKPKGRVLLSFRKEFYAEITEALGDRLAASATFLQPLSKAGIEEAVTALQDQPDLHQQYGLTVEPELPNMIADNLLDDPKSPVAPLLQVLLTDMWREAHQKNPESPVFTVAQYRELQRSGIKLHDFAQDRLREVESEFPLAARSGLLLAVLHAFTTPEGTARQQTPGEIEAHFGHTGQELKQLLRSLQNHYLLAEIVQAEGASFRLVHDTLAPVVRRLYNQSEQPGQRAQRILESAVLPSDPDHKTAYFNEQQLLFLEAGKNGMRKWADQEAKVIRTSKKILRQRKRRERLAIRILWGAVAAVALLLVGFLLINVQRQQELQSDLLETQSENALPTNPTQAYDLLEASLAKKPNYKREAKLAKLAEIARENLRFEVAYTFSDSNTVVDQGAVSLKGNYLALTRSIPATGGSELHVFSTDGLADGPVYTDRLSSTIFHLAFYENGLYGGGKDRQIHIWKPEGELIARTAHEPEKSFASVVGLSQFGLAATLTDFTDGRRQIEIHDVRKDSVMTRLRPTASVEVIQYLPKLGRLMAGLDDGKILLFDPVSRSQSLISSRVGPVRIIQPIPQNEAFVLYGRGKDSLLVARLEQGVIVPQEYLPMRDTTVQSFRFSASGRFLLVLHTDNRIDLWRWTDRQLLHRLKGHPAAVVAAGFGPAEKTVLSIDKRGHIYRWPLPPLHPDTLLEDSSYLNNVLLTPNTQFLTTDVLGRLQLRSLDNQILQTYPGHDRKISALAYAAGRVLSGDGSGKVGTWQNGQDSSGSISQRHQEAVTVVALDKTGWQASASPNKKVYVQAPNTEQPVSLPHDNRVVGLAFRGDPPELLTFDETGQVQVWDPKTRKVNRKFSLSEGLRFDRMAFNAPADILAALGYDSQDHAILILFDPGGRSIRRRTLPPDGNYRLLRACPDRPALPFAIWHTDKGVYFIDPQGYATTLIQPLRTGSRLIDLSQNGGQLVMVSHQDASTILQLWAPPAPPAIK